MITDTMGIYIRNPKVGIYYGQYRQDGKLIQVSLHTKNRREALLLWKKIQKHRREAKLNRLDNSRITISQIRKIFLEERDAFLAATSLERYKYALLALEDGLGSKALVRSLTTRKISEWASTRLKTGIKATTVNADLRHIKSVLRQAVKWGYLDKAPEIEFVKEAKKLTRHIQPEALERILDREKNLLRRRLWIFVVWTGLRRAEVLGLKWQHIVWGDGPAMKVTGKGDKERIVPLLPAAVEALGPRKDIGPVWPQVHPSRLSKWFKFAAERAEVKAHFHDLRHTCATYLLSRGVSIKAVQQILGHTDIRVTQEYTREFAGDLYDEMSKVLR